MKNFIRTFLISISTSLCLVAQLQFAISQTASILPQAETQFLNNNGDPITSGTVDFYIPNSSTRKTTWQDADRTIANTNPVRLNASGRALIYGYGGYRQVLKDRNGNLIWDRVTNSYSIPNGQITTGDGNNVGTILQWSSLTAPNQYVFAYGQELSRITYPELFAAITLAQNVNCTSASNSLSGIADTSQIPIGAVIEASCFAAAVTVTAKSSNTYTVSANATVTTTVQATVFPFGNGNAINTFNIPDLRGRVLAGRDNMGGIAASRLTTTYFANASAIGAVGGSQSHTLTVSESAVLAYTSTVHDPGHTHTLQGANSSIGNGLATLSSSITTPGEVTDTATTGITVDTVSNAGGQAHSIVQPTITINYIIKATPDQTGLAAAGVLTLGTMGGVIACDNTFLCANQNVGLAVISNDTVLANVSGGSAQSTPTTFTQWLDAVCSNVQGNVIYRGASSWNCLTPGTSGQLLKTQGAGSSPIWGNAVEGVINDVNVTGSVSGLNLTLGWLGQLSVSRGGTGTSSFTANVPLIGNGTGAISNGARSGDTTTFATTDGTFTGGSCIQYDNFGNLTPTGVACGGGGGGGTGGNPTATIPLDNTAVNGAAVTFTRSDGAPKLSKYTATGTGATARTVQNKLGDVVSILDFGGDNTGTNDNGAACTAALTSFGIHVGGTLIFPPGVYKMATACAIPSFTISGGTGAQPIVRFEMSGAQFFPAANNIAMFDRFPANQTEADNSVSARYEFQGGQFTGLDPATGIQISTGNTGIRLGASYGSYINGSIFSFGLKNGLDLQFALNAKVTNVRCNNSTDYCMIAREGQWTGATSNNSQSNDTLYENVRDGCGNGQLASFYIHATDGVILRNVISEGGNCVQDVLFDDDRNSTVKSLKIDGLHVENGGSGPVTAVITMIGAGGGVYTFQNVFDQTVTTLLDVTGFDSSGQTFNILDTDYTGAFTTAFKVQAGDSNLWNFRAWAGNIRNPALWSGGHVPGSLHNLNGSTLTVKQLVVGDTTATDSASFGIALYGPFYPEADDTYSIGIANVLRWANIYIGTGGVHAANLAGSGTQCLYTDNNGTITKAGPSPCGGTGVALMGSASSLNGQSTGDVATLTLNYPIGTTYFIPNSYKLFARSGAFNTMQVGIYTGPGQTGTVICAQGVAGTTATGFNAVGAVVSLSCAGAGNTTAVNVPTLYVNVGTGQGTANSFDISVYGNVH